MAWEPVDNRPRALSDGVVIERLPGETLVYDEGRDTVHCLGDVVAAVFELCDGTRNRAELALLAAKRLGRQLGPGELDEVLTELSANGLLTDAAGGAGVSRRQALAAGGGIAAASLITTIVAPVPAMAQSPTPPGQPDCVPAGGTCFTTMDCCEGLFCGPPVPTDRNGVGASQQQNVCRPRAG